MIEVAEAEFALDIPDKKGMTPRSRNAVAERVGQIGAEWRPPLPPDPLLHVWGWFRELNQFRRYSHHIIPTEKGFRTETSPEPLSYLDVEAWARLTDRDPSSFALDLLARLDASYFMVRSGQVKPSSPDDFPKDTANVLKTGFRTMGAVKKK